MTPDLQQKVDRAVKLIQSAGADGSVVEVSYSGGKDSDVILELTRMAGIRYRAIYKNTTIDPPGTIKHVREGGGGNDTTLTDLLRVDGGQRLSQPLPTILLSHTERV